MRIPRVFHPTPLRTGAAVDLAPGAVRRLRSVLRLNRGDEVELFDGLGGACRGQLDLLEGRRARVIVRSMLASDREPALRIELGLGVSKGERMDLAIEKSVELGVAAIQPLFTQRSVVRLDSERAGKRVAHWSGIVRSACEQCGRNRLPALAAPQRLESWLGEDCTGALALIPTPGAERSLKSLQPPQTERVVLLIGPEGGLDPGERGAAESAGFVAVRLGPRVLRTETAAIAAVAALMTLWGDLG